jgi:hypothetical protein
MAELAVILFFLVAFVLPLAIATRYDRKVRARHRAAVQEHAAYLARREAFLAGLSPMEREQWLLHEYQMNANMAEQARTRQVLGGLILWNTLQGRDGSA